MRKVKTVNLHETVSIDGTKDFTIKCYYAGHVLGAGMFLVKNNADSVLYTGDYNMTADRHLGAAKIDICRPTLLISESTYATTIRDSKRCRERDFLKKVYQTVENGGKVLIPVFALGRAQELCILLEQFWKRMNLGKVPVYFSMGLSEKATNFYKLFLTWTNEKIKQTFMERNAFDYEHIKPFDRSYSALEKYHALFSFIFVSVWKNVPFLHHFYHICAIFYHIRTIFAPCLHHLLLSQLFQRPTVKKCTVFAPFYYICTIFAPFLPYLQIICNIFTPVLRFCTIFTPFVHHIYYHHFCTNLTNFALSTPSTPCTPTTLDQWLF